jgi:hypothetical protein
MELTKTQDSRQAVRVLGNIFMVKLYHSLVFIKSRIRLFKERLENNMNKTDLINKIDKAMDRLTFLAEIMEGEKTLTTGLNNISDILYEIRGEISLNGIKEDENV